ncbi:hypothetical protein NQ317_002784 [Molorchus minor]|uniref:Uncharacterized protein n=1 Tax=Molorchus minor TaxID=1323400 RepID=A0ABQ9J6N9_9CUCU|nr:hypothetical protein NQ317_002784 [Molorchus minor]
MAFDPPAISKTNRKIFVYTQDQRRRHLTNNVLNMFIANGNYAVQTFFVISGWLLSFHFFQMIEAKKRVDLKYIFLAFINRYIRLTPVMAVVIAFESTWLVHIGRGPLWKNLIAKEYLSCRKNWWTNLLYINNYVNKKEMAFTLATSALSISTSLLAEKRTDQRSYLMVLVQVLGFGDILNNVIKALDNSQMSAFILLDYSKEFNTMIYNVSLKFLSTLLEAICLKKYRAIHNLLSKLGEQIPLKI